MPNPSTIASEEIVDLVSEIRWLRQQNQALQAEIATLLHIIKGKNELLARLAP